MNGTDPDVIVRLPAEKREAFKDPLGPIETDVHSLLPELGSPLITVGDVVSYHFYEAGRMPDVAVIDGRTKREAVDKTIEETLVAADVDRFKAINPPGTLTASLLDALDAAIEADRPVQVVVDGEEDLATVPAILLAPKHSSVIYGQPGEGMVHVEVSTATRRRARKLAKLLEGDGERLSRMVSP